jgi:hypothetical protein
VQGERVSVRVQVFVLALLFLGGGAAGVGLARSLAPESWAAQFVGLFSLSLPFAVGMQAWLGLALATELWRAAKRGGRPRNAAAGADIPGGSFAFVPTCVLLVGAAGMLIGIFGSSLGLLATTGLYLALGLSYGVACWLYAKNGYLPFPHE